VEETKLLKIRLQHESSLQRPYVNFIATKIIAHQEAIYRIENQNTQGVELKYWLQDRWRAVRENLNYNRKLFFIFDE
jgi:hypothetical protein